MSHHRRLLGGKEATPTTDTAEVFTVDTATMKGEWTGAGRMRTSRVLCDATLLADGHILVSGGAKRGWGDLNGDEVLEAELYDPTLAQPEFRPAATASTAGGTTRPRSCCRTAPSRRRATPAASAATSTIPRTG